MTDEVISFEKKRNEAIEQRRREFERILFQNFLGVYTVLDDQGSISALELLDISDKGCLFQIPCCKENIKKLKTMTEATLRIYFTDKAFIPVSVNIKYCRETMDPDGTILLKFGCEFDKAPNTFQAMESFINFMYKFAEHASIDRGNTKVLHL